MNAIKGKGQEGVLRRTSHSLEISNNFHRLSLEESDDHLAQLSKSLKDLSVLAGKESFGLSGHAPIVSSYIRRAAETIDSLVLKSQLERTGANGDLAQGCAIDPSNSGFPLMVSELHALRNTYEDAIETLGKLPGEAEIIEEAIYLMARSVHPQRQIDLLQEKHFLTKLVQIDFPDLIRVNEPTHLGEQEGQHYFLSTVERLDTNRNIPKLYVIHYKVPKESYGNELWKKELSAAINRSLTTLVDSSEFRILSENIESVEGVLLDQIIRYDIGPFHNKYTENKSNVRSVLDLGHESDSLLLFFNKYAIQRISQEKKSGIKNTWKSIWSGDEYRGTFGQTMAFPTSVLLPFRTIQQIQHSDIEIGKNVFMYGITDDGDIIE